MIWYFYPRSPCGERPPPAPQGESSITVFYPRSPCGERRPLTRHCPTRSTFSIHALLAESDCRHHSAPPLAIFFLSTLSLRRATESIQSYFPNRFIFYPRSPCGERRCRSVHHTMLYRLFYPRSPCGERPVSAVKAIISAYFLSTLSLRRATRCSRCSGCSVVFSIHALLAESDSTTFVGTKGGKHFLSTLSLRRATPVFGGTWIWKSNFLSTLSLRRATFWQK